MNENMEPDHRPPATPRGEDGAEPSTLIVGDWFVDEHWVCGVHRSSAASRTGERHFRGLHDIGTEVRAFCGAGRSAFFLHHVIDDTKPMDDTESQVQTKLFFPNLVGLGFWHQNDTEMLKSLFDPTIRAHSPYRLMDLPDQVSAPAGVALINMHDSLFMGPNHETRRSQYEYTCRIIRIYRQGGGNEFRFERFDWEPPLKTPRWEETWLTDLERNVSGSLAANRKFSVVMVKDLLRGVVTKEIVTMLAKSKCCQGARWYVSSKKWKPDWMEMLKDVNLRLFIVPQVAAREAILKEADLSRWLTLTGKPTQEALRHLEKIYEDMHDGTAHSIVVLPEGFSAICRTEQENNEMDCIVQDQTESDQPVTVPMGGASIFFPALCACMEYAKRKENSPPDTPSKFNLSMERMLRHSLTCTYDWVRSEGQRVKTPNNWDPNPKNWDWTPELLKISNALKAPRDFENVTRSNWSEEKKSWEQALNLPGRGKITSKSASGGVLNRLELWRSMVEIDGYVCCETSKRRDLQGLVQGIEDFVDHPRYHVACMLVAAPGAGKTYLVTCLAKSANLVFVPFNITQLNSRSELLSWFDTIASTQEENKGKRLLVFIDEINAGLDGDDVYSAFLSPLEEGAYIRSGKTFHLDPCVWIFAGTKNPRTPNGAGKRPGKGSDFVSRLTLGTVDLDVDVKSAPAKIQGLSEEELNKIQARSQELLNLERVYLGMSLLLREFPDVRRVSKYVLNAFLWLPGEPRVRDIKQFVRGFQNIQYGSVKSENVTPKRWPQDDVVGNAFLKWKDETVKDLRSRSEKADIEISV